MNAEGIREQEVFVEAVLKATGRLIQAEGDIPHVEAECHREWARGVDVGFTPGHLQVAKRLFRQSELYYDLTTQTQNTGGLTQDHNREYVNKFLLVKGSDFMGDA